MKYLSRNYLVLILLVLLFAAPGIMAYYFYRHNNWLASGTTNKGTLINPPILLNQSLNNAKWSFVLWSPEGCEKTCVEQLDKLARIRLALGRRLYNVDINLLLGPGSSVPSESLLTGLKDQGITVMYSSAVESNQLQKLPHTVEAYIMNPQHFIILKYALNAPSEDMYHDINHLLKTKE